MAIGMIRKRRKPPHSPPCHINLVCSVAREDTTQDASKKRAIISPLKTRANRFKLQLTHLKPAMSLDSADEVQPPTTVRMISAAKRISGNTKDQI